MPAMGNSTGAGKTATGRCCHTALCAGRAEFVQHA